MHLSRQANAHFLAPSLSGGSTKPPPPRVDIHGQLRQYVGVAIVSSSRRMGRTCGGPCGCNGAMAEQSMAEGIIGTNLSVFGCLLECHSGGYTVLLYSHFCFCIHR